MRHIPSIVPVSAQNATAVVLQDEMNRHLSKLKAMADWGAMLQELSGSRGNALLVVVLHRLKSLLETNWRSTSACSLSTGSLLQLGSRKN